MPKQSTISTLLVCCSIAATPHASTAQDALGSGRALDATTRETRSNIAQDALGDGRLLDGNTRIGGSRVNSRSASSIAANIRYQNAIVTGNIAGGRYFRGDLGYTAARDFRGATGGDLVFDLDRDAYRSGFALQGIRGAWQAAQQFQLTSGGIRSGSTDQFVLSRPGSGRNAQQVRDVQRSGQREYDRYGQIDAAIRSSAAFDLVDIERPSLLGQRNRPTGSVPLGVSPLTGIREYAADDHALSAARFDLARTDLLDIMRTTITSELKADEADEDQPRVPTISPHDTVMQQLTQRLQQQGMLDRLRTGEQDDQQGASNDGGAIFDPRGMVEQEADDLPEDPTDQLLRRLTDLLGPEADPLDGELAAPMTPSTLEELLEDARNRKVRSDLGLLDDAPADGLDAVTTAELVGVVELIKDAAALGVTLSPISETDEQDESVYQRRMSDGENALRNGNWFDAEEYFASVIATHLGDGFAALGRIAAQLGAGLTRSAASGIRETFLAYPELAPTTLDRELLPQGDRLATVTAQLISLTEKGDAASLDAAIVLAWLGYQTDQPQLITLGFESLESVSQQAGIPMRGIDLMLKRLWQ